MEGNTIIAMAGGFIGLAIMLGIGTLILGGSVSDCSTLAGAPTGGTGSAAAAQQASSYTLTTGSPSTTAGLKGSWAHQCALSAQQAQSGYSLLMVTLVILAAAVVLLVVRLLAG